MTFEEDWSRLSDSIFCATYPMMPYLAVFWVFKTFTSYFFVVCGKYGVERLDLQAIWNRTHVHQPTQQYHRSGQKPVLVFLYSMSPAVTMWASWVEMRLNPGPPSFQLHSMQTFKSLLPLVTVCPFASIAELRDLSLRLACWRLSLLNTIIVWNLQLRLGSTRSWLQAYQFLHDISLAWGCQNCEWGPCRHGLFLDLEIED